MDSLIATQEEFLSLFDRSYDVASGSTYQDYEDAMREICELMGCVYIDVNNFGFTRQNYGLYFADDINAQTNAVTHPNATGQEILGQSIAAEVISKAKGYVNWLRR